MIKELEKIVTKEIAKKEKKQLKKLIFTIKDNHASTTYDNKTAGST